MGPGPQRARGFSASPCAFYFREIERQLLWIVDGVDVCTKKKKKRASGFFPTGLGSAELGSRLDWIFALEILASRREGVGIVYILSSLSLWMCVCALENTHTKLRLY